MLFNSVDFTIFLPIVFCLYWFILNKDLRFQNLLIVSASYLFYGWWDWRFLCLIFISTLVDYTIGLKLQKQEKSLKRKILLVCSICVNIGLLGFFKYYNFFIENFTTAFTLFGLNFRAQTLNIILPIGISFYTFQTLSYTIDIYNKKIKPISDLIAFSAFVSFFPQLVAGPIERAAHLLPQFSAKRKFNYDKAVDGLRQILWGFFKKIVIADNCAYYANIIFDNSENYSANTLIIGAILFAFQIYGDFSGYSDIAIGTARLFGINLMKNFAFPYFSRDIAEFWRRWHISLSTWFRDYVYIPLGGSKVSSLKRIRNVLIIFVVSGFWHGANWTFIIWGVLNALYFLPLMLLKTNRKNLGIVSGHRLIPSVKDILNMFFTFSITCIAWIFFRSETVKHAFNYLNGIFSISLLDISTFIKDLKFLSTGAEIIYLFLLLLLFIGFEWIQRHKEHSLKFDKNSASRIFRWTLYYFVIILIIFFNGEQQGFIYFQF